MRTHEGALLRIAVNEDRKRFWTVCWLAGSLAIGVIAGGGLRAGYERGDTSAFPAEMRGAVAEAGDRMLLADGRPAPEYFENVQRIIQRHFVEPVADETPLADGAVKGMIEDLNTTGTDFYKPELWSAMGDYYQGRAHGIGALVQLVRKQRGDETVYPLVVIAVAEGSPADEAGIRPGDWIEFVNGHWVGSRSLRPEWETLHEQRDKGEITQEEFRERLEALYERVDTMILWDKAMHELLAEGRGTVEVTTLRDGKERTHRLARRVMSFEPIELSGDTVRIRTFPKGAAERLRSLLAGRESVTLDVRNNPGGAQEDVLEALSVLVPSQTLFVRQRPGESPKALKTPAGEPPHPKLTVIADATTSREAEMFVAALRAAGADVRGEETLGLGIQVARYDLPSGAGYTVTRGVYLDPEKNPLLRNGYLLRPTTASHAEEEQE